MKVLKKATIVQKAKTTEHTMTERQVLEAVRSCPFLVTLHWAFQTDSKLHLVMGESLNFATFYNALSLHILALNHCFPLVFTRYTRLKFNIRQVLVTCFEICCA